MYCDKCGQNYASVKYTQIINGKKKEMFLCGECSKELGIDKFNIPIDFSSFLSDFFIGFEEDNNIPQLPKNKELKCSRCNFTFEDFINAGRFGCGECYSNFEEKIDPFLRSIQGANRHIGRVGKIESEDKEKMENWEDEKEKVKDTMKLGEIYELRRQLKVAIKEEKYEEAASLRDRIKEIEGEI